MRLAYVPGYYNPDVPTGKNAHVRQFVAYTVALGHEIWTWSQLSLPNTHVLPQPPVRLLRARWQIDVLYKYGGIYVDMDMMFLRDMRSLICSGCFHDEFCYQWSSHMPHGNSAVLRLRERSPTALALLARCAAAGTCHPRHAFGFAENWDLELFVLPCPAFDPLWPNHDRRDRYHAAPFSRFEDFFHRFGIWFSPQTRHPIAQRLLSRSVHVSLAQLLGRAGA
jgi:hypothetical protein